MDDQKQPITPQAVLDRQARTKERIYQYLENGLFFRDACIVSGIDESTGHRWKQKDASFASRVEASISKYAEKLIRCINAQATRDGRLALRILQARFPEEWNPNRKIQIYDAEAELKRIQELIYGKDENS